MFELATLAPSAAVTSARIASREAARTGSGAWNGRLRTAATCGASRSTSARAAPSLTGDGRERHDCRPGQHRGASHRVSLLGTLKVSRNPPR